MRFLAWWRRPRWGKSLDFSGFFEGHAYRLPRFFCADAAIEVGSAGAAVEAGTEFGAGTVVAAAGACAGAARRSAGAS
jgi:hypothetical protein